MILLWFFLSLFVSLTTATFCSEKVNTIQSEPVLIKNTLARNFKGLKLSVKFLLVNISYYWTHHGLPPTENHFYSPFSSCINKKNRFQVTCLQRSCGGSTYLLSSLTLLFPFNKNVTFAVIPSGNKPPIALITITVRDCATRSGRSLEVVSQSSDYNAVGEFRCRNNGILFYSNKTRLGSNKTKCLAAAEWKDFDVVQCWTGPSNVFVVGNLTVIEGDNINLKCQHLSSFPASNRSLFTFNGTATSVEKGKVFTITNVQKANHNQSVSCQVQSPYVAIVDRSSGQSQERFINVLYPPYATSPKQCTWEVNAPGICKISLQSNPNAQFRSVLFNGTDIIHSAEATNVFGWQLISLASTQKFIFDSREKVDKTFAGSYELVVFSNGFGETKIHFKINVVDQFPSTQPPQPTATNSTQPVVISCAILGTLVAVATAILLVRIYSKKKKAGTFEKSNGENYKAMNHTTDGQKLEVENVIYDAAPDRDHPAVPDMYMASGNIQIEAAYGMVNGTKKKKQRNPGKKSADLIPEDENVNNEITYGVVNRTKKKQKKKAVDESATLNTNMQTVNVERDATYGAVDKAKKTRKKKTIDKPVAFNTNTPSSPFESDAAYGVVNKTKKKQKKKITDKPAVRDTDLAIDNDQAEAAYGSVGKPKKKKQTNPDNRSPAPPTDDILADDTYAEVNKMKRKKKKKE